MLAAEPDRNDSPSSHFLRGGAAYLKAKSEATEVIDALAPLASAFEIEEVEPSCRLVRFPEHHNLAGRRWHKPTRPFAEGFYCIPETGIPLIFHYYWTKQLAEA